MFKKIFKNYTWAKPRQWLIAGIVAAGVLLIDQVSKLLVVTSMELHQSINVINPILRITYLENHQGIFGLSYGPGFIYIILSVAAICLVAVFFLLRPQTKFVTVLMGMILGGGFSNNLIDRIRLGYVIDWIDMGLRNWRFWGVYNIADACIVVPVILLLAYELFRGKQRKPDEKSQGD